MTVQFIDSTMLELPNGPCSCSIDHLFLTDFNKEFIKVSTIVIIISRIIVHLMNTLFKDNIVGILISFITLRSTYGNRIKF